VNKDGVIQKANLIIATAQNNIAMNRTVRQIATHFIDGKKGKITEGILNRVEAGIRCYDPCLSCSTHALGQMPLHVELVSASGEVLDEVRR
jgi:NAD-reducing hydrogenase large subunit